MFIGPSRPTMAALLSLFLACLLSSSTGQEQQTNGTNTRILGMDNSNVGGFFTDVGKSIVKEVADIKQPVDVGLAFIGSSQCQNVKKIVGVAYDQIEGEREPDVNKLSLKYITSAYTVTYNINDAARSIPASRDYDPHQKLYIFIHGFIDNPFMASFSYISSALFAQGRSNVLALDGSSLIHWLYLRSTTYVRFMGEKLGEVLAAMVNSGVDPADIHIIGHSLGAHISGFTGKQFNNLTGQRVGRISGLDPAGPCFSHVDEDLRLKNTDAVFVDVMHTDDGVYGLTDPVGDVDYFPNDGAQQPECVLQTCSHNRAWEYYTESILNPKAFPAVPCDSYKAFKESNCFSEISYMGFPSKPGTTGRYYLQTNGTAPYGLGPLGTTYRNKDGIVKSIASLLG